MFGQRDLAEDAELGECELGGWKRRAAQLQEPVAQRKLVERGGREAGDRRSWMVVIESRSGIATMVVAAGIHLTCQIALGRRDPRL